MNACGLDLHSRRGFKSEPWPRRVLAPPQGSLPCWVLLIVEDVEREKLMSKMALELKCAHASTKQRPTSPILCLHPDFLSAAQGIEDWLVWKEGGCEKKVAHILRAVSHDKYTSWFALTNNS